MWNYKINTSLSLYCNIYYLNNKIVPYNNKNNIYKGLLFLKKHSSIRHLKLFPILARRQPHCCREHPHEMRQVVKTNHIANLRHSFLRVLQQLASCVQTVLRDELWKGHHFVLFEIGAKRRTVHPHLLRNVVQCDGMNIVFHHVCANLLHTPNVLLDAHRFPCKYMVGRGENNRKQTKHRT